MAKYNRIITPRGVAVYPHLHSPDFEFDSAGIFDTKLRVSEGDAQEFMEKVKTEYKAFAKENKLKVRQQGLPWTEDEDNPGHILIKAKMKHNITTRDGDTITKTPVILDAAKNKLQPGLRIGGGSEMKLSCLMVPYKGFGGGVSLRLMAVQVLKLVTFGGDYGFDEEDGFTAEASFDEESALDGGEDSPADDQQDDDEYDASDF